jgi:hypothetical protein
MHINVAFTLVHTLENGGIIAGHKVRLTPYALNHNRLQ